MKKRVKKKAKPDARRQAAEEAREEIVTAAREGVEMVTARMESLQDEPNINMLSRMALEDILTSALDTGEAQLAGIMKNCRLCVMAAWQLGRAGQVPDFLPGEAMPIILRAIKDIPQESQEHNIRIAASLASTAQSTTLAAQGRAASGRMHLWVAFLNGRDQRAMDGGLQ